MKKIAAGLLAHVDAGKTTLSEAMLYTAGILRTPGRVDRRNTFLDTHELERERGITIFSKQAILRTGDLQLTLLDTPGHTDFSAEAERTLAVLDYAILVISGSGGVESHTETLWRLLERCRIPTFLFVSKMDLAGSDRAALLADLTGRLHPACVDFSLAEGLEERIALCDESALERYAETGYVPDTDIARLIRERKLFPCFFGSGLRCEGVDALLRALETYTKEEPASDAFGARVYKIAHDAAGNRLTFCRITGGTLSVRQALSYVPEKADESLEEKVTGIRLYSGIRYETPESIGAGEICALTGLTATYAGQGLGAEPDWVPPALPPVLHYRISLPRDVPPAVMLPKLRELEEEEPLLHIVWSERFAEIHAQVMGQVQTEVLTELIRARYGVDVRFDDGQILYKETIGAAFEGVGHYEPLRHYAEVHLLLEPLPRGSGLLFATDCPPDTLAVNWQRLVLTHLAEKQHLGVLTGSPVTDMKITLIAGRSHLKHTSGGDFRESTYRAVRQGLMEAKAAGRCILLEPVYDYTLEVPSENVGRAISDLVARSATFGERAAPPGMSALSGQAPVSTVSDYAREVAAYTHGKGRFICRPGGYSLCHDTDAVIAAADYRPEADPDNPADSVFCARGAGMLVPWNEVKSRMHLPGLRDRGASDAEKDSVHRRRALDEKELEALMEREFGPIRRPVYGEARVARTTDGKKIPEIRTSLYIVDGYNVIFAWDELKTIAENDLEGARGHLLDLLANYQAFTGREIVVVFDAYNVKGSVERKFDYHGLHVVFTKENELGDTYIERLVGEIGRDFSVRVVTSDGLIQLQALRTGVLRLSAREFREEIISTDREIGAFLEKLAKDR